MRIYSSVRYVFSTTPRSLRKIRYNFYLKNWLERKRNRGFLEKSRNNVKDYVINKNPLVSVQIPTYNRGEILTERTIPSVLKQTYQNFEIIIVGDHCTDNTEKLVKKLNDERIKFYNLSKRGNYPANPSERWLVAGVTPGNKAIELGRGDWIAPLDDDDEFSEDHIEVLLNHALEHDLEMVYGKVKMEVQPNKWIELGSYPLKRNKISRISVLYSLRLNFFKYDINSWKYLEPADWNLWRKMEEAGVKIGFVDKIVGKHYLERTQMSV